MLNNKNFDHSKLLELVESGMKISVVNGESILKPAHGDIETHVLMDENYFVDTWLTQFAIDKVGGKNYFDIDTWGDLTNNMVKGAIIVNQEEKQALFVIPSFIHYNLSDRGQELIDYYSRIGAFTKNTTDKAEQGRIVQTYSERINEIVSMENTGPLTITDLIPLEFYKKYGLNPKAMKAAIYIRDNYKYNGETIEPSSPEFEIIEKTLKEHFDGETVNEAGKFLITKITGGAFDFESRVTKNSDNKKEVKHLQTDNNEDSFYD